MDNSPSMANAVQSAASKASRMHHEYVTPEHMLYCMMQQEEFIAAMQQCEINSKPIVKKLESWLKDQEVMGTAYTLPLPSLQFTEMMKNAMELAVKEKSKWVCASNYVEAILMLRDSMAAYIFGSSVEGQEEQLFVMLDMQYDQDTDEDVFDYDDEYGDDTRTRPENWKSLVTNISKEAKTHTPLIGREEELERTMQVLCRMEKNNPLHVGDPGVGKTAIIYGLATLINEDRVPQRLRYRTIYGMNMGTMLAGAQYRGDFEKRLKLVLEGAMEDNAILYIDEIHNIIGAGRGGDGGPDASNILKPYLESGKLSFIGATTHEDFNRKMAKDRAIVRRFQTIDILEPSVEDTIKIMYGLQPSLQKFHNVVIRKNVLEYAVRVSAKYIPDRHLPDKAIDLVDEAGAYIETHRPGKSRMYVTKAHIDQVLQKVCRIKAEALKDDDNEGLLTLQGNILSQIYGQDHAVEKLTDAVMMAKAGLNDDNKPMASLLFVGPTGVGKTEVARILAKELGVELVRFDMSEYTEKHTVAKLIGSPAGYVGYEDGGQLTDAIRNTPNCVLLLDEIEKAHSDIYNILLQVMDYAKLTDNRGQKSDFRNVILIMTSNAGAQYASQASIGFAGGVSRGEAMLTQVKKTFKPEFINRLNDIVVFSDMDEKMATMILHKKLGELEQKLHAKQLSLDISSEAFSVLLKKGFTKEYGAREMDRVIARELKPMLMREILFGKPQKGATINICVEEDKLTIKSGKAQLREAPKE